MPKEQHPEDLERYPLNLLLCKTCGHSQLDALVDPGEIYSKYLYTTSISLGLTDHFDRYADAVSSKLELKPGAFVVDIGSNDGTLLRAFQRRGMKVLGVDPAKNIAQQATASGIPTINAFFDSSVASQIRKEHGGASLAIANNVVANVPSPGEFIEGVQKLLGEKGHFVWETGYVRYLTEGYVFDNIHHEHIDYYAIRPLVEFYRNRGLSLFDVEVSGSKGSSIRCYVASTEQNELISPKVRELVNREEEKGYFTSTPYERLTAKLDATRNILHQMLSKLRANGKTIAGYGAAIGTTTVLYHLQLGPYLDYLIDDNPIRSGLYSPGLALPVYRSERLAGPNRPDYAVILAWRYNKPILERNNQFFNNGGEFIQILPEVRIVNSAAASLDFEGQCPNH